MNHVNDCPAICWSEYLRHMEKSPHNENEDKITQFEKAKIHKVNVSIIQIYI
jgi:hypothetical protein